MTTEEKAARYDEAIERMKSWARGEHPECFTEAQKAAEFIFPELAESEDERVRKALIKLVKKTGEGYENVIDGVSIENAIAWLEKQSEQKSFDDIAKEVTKDKDAAVSFLKSTGIINENGELADEYKIEQDEQKPTDNVEPKFHEGDWVVDNCGDAWKIEGILNQFYLLESVEGGESRPTIEWVNKTFRPWTIQDAKDGDVLVSSYNQPFLFKEVVCDEFGKVCCAYGGIDGSKKFIANTHEKKFWTESEGVEVATKEQRDLLFQKMKEAGYEWDAEKKELKKIEQKPNPYSGTSFEYNGHTYGMCARDNGVDILIDSKLKTHVSLDTNQNPAWGEKDEEVHRKCICAMRASACGFPEEEKFVEQVDNWLKSLKDRVLPQPKQEWSEEDESKRKFIEDELSGLIADEREIESPLSSRHKDLYSALHWLKSLKQRYTWKPSVEQIEALESATANCAYSEYQDCLRELIGQLKKLRGE